MKRNSVIQLYLKETQSYSKNLMLLQKERRSKLLSIFILKGMIRMLHLLRRNIYFICPYLLDMMLIPFFFYLIQFPRVPISTYIILLYILLASSFHMEKVKHVDRFIISLPVSKRK